MALLQVGLHKYSSSFFPSADYGHYVINLDPKIWSVYFGRHCHSDWAKLGGLHIPYASGFMYISYECSEIQNVLP